MRALCLQRYLRRRFSLTNRAFAIDMHPRKKISGCIFLCCKSLAGSLGDVAFGIHIFSAAAADLSALAAADHFLILFIIFQQLLHGNIRSMTIIFAVKMQKERRLPAFRMFLDAASAENACARSSLLALTHFPLFAAKNIFTPSSAFPFLSDSKKRKYEDHRHSNILTEANNIYIDNYEY